MSKSTEIYPNSHMTLSPENNPETVIAKMSLLSKGLNFLSSLTCSHKHTMLIKFDIRHNANPKFRGTRHEYQTIRLHPNSQYYRCTDCRQKIPSTYMQSTIQKTNPS